MLTFENSNQHLPPGVGMPNRTMWSAYILPFIDQQNIYAAIDFETGFTDPTVANANNLKNLKISFPLMVCPSADVPEKQFDQIVGFERSPACYLACASGLLAREAGPLPWSGMDAYGPHSASDGIFYVNSETAIESIKDGSSNTALIGESLPDQDIGGDDLSGTFQKVDHWYIGSTELDSMETTILKSLESGENSECLGSTACLINSLLMGDKTTLDEKELAFGSRHQNGINMGYADGHIQFIADSVNAKVWSAIGTRTGGEVVPAF